MSGFVGILNLDGAPVDRELLERMTQALAFRGPDGQGIWCGGNVGLGHAMFCVTRESAHERQPFQFGTQSWIIADARVDARAELINKLNEGSPGRKVSLATPDVELILAAHERWGEDCVNHLLGDFSFAIWDATERRLFCGRDQFGGKPFYYAKINSCLIFSNTLNCVRMHPAVSNRLNDLAIADFLLFEVNQDTSTTSFADIRRLPPAHILTSVRDQISVRRYWKLSVAAPVHFRRPEEYVERFRELLDMAVADRVRTNSAGVLMSGGLDSTTVAASATRVIGSRGTEGGIRAYTDVLDRIVPHEERHYAKLAADALGIPIEFFVVDHWKIFERADQSEFWSPEPTHMAWPDSIRDQLRKAAAQARVVLTGYGGDPALCGRITIHFRQLLKNRRFARAILDAGRYLGAEGRLSRLYIATRWRIVFADKTRSPTRPGWLNEDLEKEFDLNDRWRTVNGAVIRAPENTVRSEAHEAITSPLWVDLFEWCQAGVTGIPVEVYHPIFDLRLLAFLLALPTLPWCSDKELFRAAARGVLPDRVRLRRKSPMSRLPLNVVLQRPESAWVDRFQPVPELQRYVIRDRVPVVHKEWDSWKASVNLRPLSLNFWLKKNSTIDPRNGRV